MWPNPQFPTDLVTFIEEIRNGKLQFLCSAGKVALAIHVVNNISCITCAWALYKTISNSNIHLSKLVRTRPSPTAIIKQRVIFFNSFQLVWRECSNSSSLQKQPPEVFWKKRSSEKFRKILRKTPVPETLF